MMLLIFGLMLIGSVYILAGWFRQGWRRRFPLSIYNAALAMALGMDLHAIGMMMTLYGRLEQILVDGHSFASDDPIYFIGASLVIAGKSLFVWVASMGEGQTYSRKFWWSYWTLLASWSLFCGSFYA